MRNLNLYLVLLALVSVTFTQCKKEGCTNPAATNYDEKAKKDDGSCILPEEEEEKEEKVFEPQTLDTAITDKVELGGDGMVHTLAGPVVIKSGGQLKINEGAIIKTDPSVDSNDLYIVVEQGGELNIKGKKDNPVIFKSGEANPARGDWGGIILCGSAPIDNAGNINGHVYGGTDSASTSGSIKYVVIRDYGAPSFDYDFAALSLYAVGSGTEVENVQAYQGNDDGFLVSGGTVVLENLIATDIIGTGIKFWNNWTGSLTDMIMESSGFFAGTAVEVRNPDALTRSANWPSISNVTARSTNGITGGSNAIILDAGASGTVDNVKVENYSAAIYLNSEQVADNYLRDNTLVVTNVNQTDVTDDLYFVPGFNDSNDTNAATAKLDTDAPNNSASGAGAKGSWAL